MKSRNELVEEIKLELVGLSEGITTIKVKELREALLRISDASMDACEVEEKAVGENVIDTLVINGEKFPVKKELNGVIGHLYNSAITASRKLREDFTKDI